MPSATTRKLVQPPSFQRSRPRLPRSGPLIANHKRVPVRLRQAPPASPALMVRGGPALVAQDATPFHGPCVPDGGTARAKASLIRCSAEAAEPRRSPKVVVPSSKHAGTPTSRLLCESAPLRRERPGFVATRDAPGAHRSWRRLRVAHCYAPRPPGDPSPRKNQQACRKAYRGHG